MFKHKINYRITKKVGEILKKTLFIKNAIILTVSSLLLRFAGIIFKVWLAAEIGSEGIGLYQLIFSVYVLITAFATSGISTAVTKLVAEELALGSKKGTLKILKRAITLSLIIAFVSAAAVFFGSNLIAQHLLGDMRAVSALKILPFSLPFMGTTACLRGYFIARRRASPNAVSQIFEQIIRIGIILILVKRFASGGLEISCAAIVFGDVTAEIFSFLILYTVHLFDRRKLNILSGRALPDYPVCKKILGIATPITSGRYINSLLRTGENILVPKNLAKYPFSGESALSQFGMIKGMALPILFFPSAILNSVSLLLIPEMSEASAKNQYLLVKRATHNILKLTAVISFIFSAVFFVAGNKIGLIIYKNSQVGFLLCALSPIVPFMYLDSISDGILKGLDQQLFTFRTAISDSTIRIILILILLPLTGLKGFIGIMYFSNLLTCFLNVGRLIKVTGANFKIIDEILLPLLSAFLVTFLSNRLVALIFGGNNLLYVISLCFISVILYTLLLFWLGIIKKDDVRNLLR